MLLTTDACSGHLRTSQLKPQLLAPPDSTNYSAEVLHERLRALQQRRRTLADHQSALNGSAATSFLAG
jgi:hypothetical protein